MACLCNYRNVISGGLYCHFTIQVQIGNVQVVEWRVGTPYEDLTLPEGTGIIFRWSGSYHNLLEISSPVENNCKFVNKDSFQLGQVMGEICEEERFVLDLVV